VKIFLIRHGHAVDEDRQLSDSERFLSRKGRKSVREVGRALRRASVTFDAVLTSPLVRAVQTAELLGEQLGYEGVIEVVPSLQPMGPIEAAQQEILQRSRHIAVVGHEPSISALCGILCGRGHFPPLRKAQVVCLSGAEVAWTLDPDRLEPQPL